MLCLVADSHHIDRALADFEAGQPIPAPDQPWGAEWLAVIGDLAEAMSGAVTVTGFPGRDPAVTLIIEHTTSPDAVPGVLITVEGIGGPLCIARAHYDLDGPQPRFQHSDGRDQAPGEYDTAGLWRAITEQLDTSLAALDHALTDPARPLTSSPQPHASTRHRRCRPGPEGHAPQVAAHRIHDRSIPMGTNICPIECLLELAPDPSRWHHDRHQPSGRWIFEGHNGTRVLLGDQGGRFHATVITAGLSGVPLTDLDLGTDLPRAQVAVEGLEAMRSGDYGQRRLEWTATGPDPVLRAREVHDYEGPFDFFARVVVADPGGETRWSVYGPVDPVRTDIAARSVEHAQQSALAVMRAQLCTDLQLDVHGGLPERTGHCRYPNHGCSFEPPPTAGPGTASPA